MIKPHLKKWLAISLLAASFSTLQGQSVPQDYIVMDMVHHNPGEPMTETSFREPAKLASYGYNGLTSSSFRNAPSPSTSSISVYFLKAARNANGLYPCKKRSGNKSEIATNKD